MHKHIVRHFAARKLQHRGPEQGVKINDVLADEVILLDLIVGHEIIKGALLAVGFGFAGFEIGLEAGQITYRRVQPDIEILARLVGDLDAEVGCVAGNIPVVEILATVA